MFDFEFEQIPDAVWREAEEIARQRGFDELHECWWPMVSRYAGELMAERAVPAAAALVPAALALAPAAPVLAVATVVVGALWWFNR